MVTGLQNYLWEGLYQFHVTDTGVNNKMWTTDVLN